MRDKKQKSPCPRKDEGAKDDLHVPMNGQIVSDVLGSYTGVPADGGQPVQDADDL